MTDGLNVCHVVNVAGTTSMPADLATAQAKFKGIGEVGLLAWFNIEPFRGMGEIQYECLGIDDSLLVNKNHYAEIKSVISEYDIVHTHHPHSGFYGKLIAKNLGKSIVHTEHNSHNGFTQKGRVATGITNIFSDSIVCVSKSVLESFKKWEGTIINDQQICVINNGVDLNRIKSAQQIEWSIYDIADINPEAIVVGSAGMLTEQKAHRVLIEAVEKANKQSDIPIELVITGDGELREKLETQISVSEHSSRLHLLGFLDNRKKVYKMMHEIDIYSMPSRWEGFCVAALESMAIGNACVFSNIPEFRQPFDDVARFHDVDDIDMLADELLNLCTNQQFKKEGDKAQKLVANSYTMEQTAQKYVNLYQHL